jgi:hypothetical protein
MADAGVDDRVVAMEVAMEDGTELLLPPEAVVLRGEEGVA